MSITDLPWRAILLVLMEKNDPDDIKSTAVAAVGSWEKLRTSLTPLLGPYGVYLIYKRSLDLNKSVFPWLPMAAMNPSSQTPFADLRLAFEAEAGIDVLRANLALLETFAGLLSALIGERLTCLFLRSAFQDDGPDQEDCR